MTPDDYLGPEAAAKVKIDAMLTASGWAPSTQTSTGPL